MNKVACLILSRGTLCSDHDESGAEGGCGMHHETRQNTSFSLSPCLSPQEHTAKGNVTPVQVCTVETVPLPGQAGAVLGFSLVPTPMLPHLQLLLASVLLTQSRTTGWSFLPSAMPGCGRFNHYCGGCHPTDGWCVAVACGCHTGQVPGYRSTVTLSPGTKRRY